MFVSRFSVKRKMKLSCFDEGLGEGGILTLVSCDLFDNTLIAMEYTCSGNL
jgi:hypothetical protein